MLYRNTSPEQKQQQNITWQMYISLWANVNDLHIMQCLFNRHTYDHLSCHFLAHSVTEWSYAIMRRPSSVRLSVRPSVNFLRKSLLLPDKWLDRDQTCTRWFPDSPASRVFWRSRSSPASRDTGTYMISQKSLLLPGKRLNPDQTQSFPNLPFPLSVRFSSASQTANGCEFALWVPP